MEVFFRIHEEMPREGPGDAASTRRAWSMLPDLVERPDVLDVGCGPGLQTIEIATLSRGLVVALDLHDRYLRQLEKSARAAGVRDRIEPCVGSMFELPFADARFDVVWSEGAIYILGFERGLREWRRLLKPRGCLVVSHLSWLTPSPSHEAKDFWATNYPAIADVATNLCIANEAGYEHLGHFALPESAWWHDYYRPLEARLARLRDEYQDDEIANRVIAGTQSEIDLYRRHSDEYGYVFYVLQRETLHE